MAILPVKVFGLMGYVVFNYMFKWSDTRWDRDLRDRGFLFSPTYISGEDMWWWLGQEKHCFARKGCILITKEEPDAEDEEDKADMAKERSLADIIGQLGLMLACRHQLYGLQDVMS